MKFPQSMFVGVTSISCHWAHSLSQALLPSLVVSRCCPQARVPLISKASRPGAGSWMAAPGMCPLQSWCRGGPSRLSPSSVPSACHPDRILGGALELEFLLCLGSPTSTAPNILPLRRSASLKKDRFLKLPLPFS